MSVNRPPVCRLALCLSALAWSSNIQAQEPPSTQPGPPQDQVIAVDGTAADASGRVAVNGAAGVNNQQLSSAMIALGAVATNHQNIAQRNIVLPDQDRRSSVVVEDGAFAGNSGMVSVNLTAGNQNQSANLAALAMGSIGAMSDQLLEQSHASTQPSGGTGEAENARNDSVEIGDTAFQDNSGLVQINLIGGEGNSSANIFQLSVSAGTNP